MKKEELTRLFKKMSDLHVVVVGDVMLDNYWWGEVDRVSPEAPVPVVMLKKRESRMGGAANVAMNCKALGAKVTLASVVGKDHEGHQLKDMAEHEGIDTSLLMLSNDRITTTKTRIMSRSQHILRMDDETTEELSTKDEHPFIDKLLKYLQMQKPDVLIFEDYNKGVLKENVIERTINHCREIGMVVAVDPKKKNFLSYKGVTIFKPNLKEVREGLNIPLSNVNKANMDKVHKELQAALHHDITFVTLSEKGVYYGNSGSELLPSHLRSIADVSGAGDTVIATASIVYALTKDPSVMAKVSNIAGGLVCEDVGVVPINKKRLMEECVRLLGE
ncbi:MAG: carbohydrate kinase [Chitinophagaceae bacterium]|nr:carbohydrate kinase [Chitinophagaceae bacterium]